MLLQKVHCLRLLNRYEESIQLLDQLIDRSENDRTLDFKGKNSEELKHFRGLIGEQLSKSGVSQVLPMNLREGESNVSDFDGEFWIHPACDLRSHPNKGRHFIATEFVPKGSVVLMENPFSCAINATESTNYCHNCRQSLDNKLWPCRGCDEVVFCGEDCSREVHHKYHKHECGFAGFIKKMYGDHFVHTFRLIARYGVYRAIDWDSSQSPETVFDLKKYISTGIPSEEPLKFDTFYHAFNSLLDHTFQCDDYTWLKLAFKSIGTAFLLNHALRTHLDEPSLITLADISMRISRRVAVNSFGQNVFVPMRKSVSSCLLIISSLFNHSCDPNLRWTIQNRQLVATTREDIEAGEELNWTYGPTIRNKEFTERQIQLKRKYHFTCSCKGCLRDCRSFLALRCHHCSGPVIYNLPLPSVVKDKGAYCLECGSKFRKLKKLGKKIEGSKTLFEKSIQDLDNEIDSEMALEMAGKSLIKLLDVSYSRSGPLLQYVNRLMSAYRDHNRLREAIQLSRAIERSIQLELKDSKSDRTTPSLVLEYFIIATSCYYKYLKKKEKSESEDSSDWERCFKMYENLLELLEQNASLERSKTEQNGNDGDVDELKKRIQLFTDNIDLKKQEMQELRQNSRH